VVKRVTYELGDASACKAAETTQVALSGEFDRRLFLILENLYILSSVVARDWKQR
jgi:hypothetical protein